MPGPAGIGSLGYAGGGGIPVAAQTSLSLIAARRLIYARLISYWASRGETAPLTFDNEAYTGPVGPWVRCVVRHTTSEQRTLGRIGDRRFRRSGLILCQCFNVVNIGWESVDTLAGAVLSIFEGSKFSTIECYASASRELKPDRLYAGNLVEIPFDYDEIK